MIIHAIHTLLMLGYIYNIIVFISAGIHIIYIIVFISAGIHI